MTWKIYDNNKQQYLEGDWVTWHNALDFMIDNDPQLEYIHREEMEDIVLSRFTNFGGDEFSLVEEVVK